MFRNRPLFLENSAEGYCVYLFPFYIFFIFVPLYPFAIYTVIFVQTNYFFNPLQNYLFHGMINVPLDFPVCNKVLFPLQTRRNNPHTLHSKRITTREVSICKLIHVRKKPLCIHIPVNIEQIYLPDSNMAPCEGQYWTVTYICMDKIVSLSRQSEHFILYASFGCIIPWQACVCVFL